MESKRPYKIAVQSLLASSILLTCGMAYSEPSAEDHSLFKQLFSKKIDLVQQTRDVKDDVVLIEEMHRAAISIPDSPEVQRLIYRAIIDLADSSKLYIMAVDAMDLLHEGFPDDPAADPDRALALLELGYRTSRRDERESVGERYITSLMQRAERLITKSELQEASQTYRRARLIARDIDSEKFDTIDVAIDRVDRQSRTDTRIKSLQNELRLNSNNSAAAQELTLLLAINKDDPTSALEYVEHTKNTGLTETVRLATKDPSELDADEAIRLAEWYFNQASQGDYDGDIKLRLYDRSIQYSDLMLEQYSKRDAKRLRVSAIRKNATERADELSDKHEIETPADDWIDLIDRFDASKHSLGDRLTKEEGKITSTKTDFVLPVSPEAGYDLELSFKFTGGETGINFTLPIDGHSFTLLYSRYFHKRTELLGHDVIETKQPMLRPGQEVDLTIRVRHIAGRGSGVQFLINGKNAIKWQGNANELVLNKETPTPETFGQGIRVTCGGTFHFDQIRFREVKGE